MTRYLLGELSRDECVAFEETCFADDERFEELQAVEAELTDDYVRGRLSGPRRARFEERLLNSPGRREEVEFARIIAAGRDAAARAPTPARATRPRAGWTVPFLWLGAQGRALRVSLAAAALLLVAVGLWSPWSSRQTDS